MPELPDLLKAARLEAGLTQEALAAQARVSVSTVRWAEKGVHTPSEATLSRLMAILKPSAVADPTGDAA